uniref:Calreticulin n=1 Tax=Lygus hesperus TaxID=30085 RepID=A0A0A9Y9E2_LYGHE
MFSTPTTLNFRLPPYAGVCLDCCIHGIHLPRQMDTHSQTDPDPAESQDDRITHTAASPDRKKPEEHHHQTDRRAEPPQARPPTHADRRKKKYRSRRCAAAE